MASSPEPHHSAPRSPGPVTAEQLIAALAAGAVPAPEMDARHATGFVLQLARALHLCGLPAYRTEELLGRVSERLGLAAQFFSTPTSLMVAFGPDDRQDTHLLRMEPGEVNLAKLSAVDGVVRDVMEGAMTPATGSGAIARIIAAGPRYGAALVTLAFGVTSAAAARLLGGGLTEITVAGALGLVTGVLGALLGRGTATGRVFEFVAAFVAAFLAVAALAVSGRYSAVTAILAGLIVLLPGFMLTTALTELATRHLTSGTSRLTGAFMIFVGIGFGMALGSTLGEVLFHPPAPAAAVPLPDWTYVLAVAAISLGFVALLQAAPSDAPWIVLAGAVAVVASRLGARWVGPELGSFVGGLVVGVGSNLLARWRDRSTLVTQTPGVLILVPGSVGFRGLISMLDDRMIAGLEAAFQMILVAVSIVAGLLVANVISPQRRIT